MGTDIALMTRLLLLISLTTAATLLCFDRSYKGSNIALMVELLAGPLVGGAVQDKLGSKNWGNLMIALDPAIMGDPKQILHNVQLMLDRVKGARKANGVAEIMLPGERGNRLARELLGNMSALQIRHPVSTQLTNCTIMLPAESGNRLAHELPGNERRLHLAFWKP